MVRMGASSASAADRGKRRRVDLYLRNTRKQFQCSGFCRMCIDPAHQRNDIMVAGIIVPSWGWLGQCPLRVAPALPLLAQAHNRLPYAGPIRASLFDIDQRQKP